MEIFSEYWGYILVFLMFILSTFVSSRIRKTYEIYSLSKCIERLHRQAGS